MGKKGKKAAAGKPKKLTPKDIGKRLDALAKKLEEELKGADLFAPLPPLTEDCANCLLPRPRLVNKSVYMSCCGHFICIGCMGESDELSGSSKGEKVAANACPFCRAPTPTSREQVIRQLQARALKGDCRALRLLGQKYLHGEDGLPKDELKALDSWIRAAELGSDSACGLIGDSFEEGSDGISKDLGKAALFYRVAALRGDIISRHNIGYFEYDEFGNHEIGICHWKIAAEAGFQPSLNKLRDIYNADGKKPGKQFISKEDLDRVYRAGHGAQEEVKSEERKKYFKREKTI